MRGRPDNVAAEHHPGAPKEGATCILQRHQTDGGWASACRPFVKFCNDCLRFEEARVTLSIAFRHLPPNSARFRYATEGPLFISAQLCPVTRSGPSERFGYRSNLAPKYARKHETHPPRGKKKKFRLDSNDCGFVCAGVNFVGIQVNRFIFGKVCRCVQHQNKRVGMLNGYICGHADS